MEILLEENKDLKEELTGYKNITYDIRMKKITEENNYLNERVG
jgi:hypothetical protein